MTEMHDLSRDWQRVSPKPTRTFNSPPLGALGFHPLVEVVADRDDVTDGLVSRLHEGTIK